MGVRLAGALKQTFMRRSYSARSEEVVLVLGSAWSLVWVSVWQLSVLGCGDGDAGSAGTEIEGARRTRASCESRLSMPE